MNERPPVVPSEERASRRGRYWLWILPSGALAIGLAVLYFHRPQGQFFFPRCSFHTLTGLLCPGCGGLRAVHELLNGRLLAAVRSNPLFVVGLPLALGWWVWRRHRGLPSAVAAPAVWWLFAAVVVFTVLRNLPWTPFRWLSP